MRLKSNFVNPSNDKSSFFQQYYSSQKFVDNIWLPQHPAQHHFRLELFSSTNLRTFGRIRKSVRTKAILRNHVKNTNVASIYFTPIRWLDPINLRKSKSKFYDCMLSSPLYFDIDKTILNDKTLRSAKATVQAIIDFILKEFNRKADLIVFSGSNGFHIYYWDWDNIPRIQTHPNERLASFKSDRKELVHLLEKKGILVDPEVTSDPWRILRLPGSLHPETGLLATIVEDLNKFSPLKDSLVFDRKTYITSFSLGSAEYQI